MSRKLKVDVQEEAKQPLVVSVSEADKDDDESILLRFTRFDGHPHTAALIAFTGRDPKVVNIMDLGEEYHYWLTLPADQVVLALTNNFAGYYNLITGEPLPYTWSPS